MALTEPAQLYTAAQSRAIDRCAIEEHGLPGPLLMARAARAALRELLQRWPAPELLQVLCGPGNNGGDGLLLAVLAAGKAIPVKVYLVDGEPRSDDAKLALARLKGAGVTAMAFSTDVLETRGVVVDGMLGTGISGEPRAAYRAAISAINSMALPVMALDVPSGLDADTGAPASEVVHASATVSFISGKRGLYSAAGPDCAGERLLDDLEVPAEAYAAAGETVEVLSLEHELRKLPPLRPSTHKGAMGRCLILGGDRGMGGAVLLAAEAALRCGSGLLRVATRDEYVAPLLARTPEAMATPVRGYPEVQPLIPWADAVVVGPGLGSAPWGEQLLHAALNPAESDDRQPAPLLLDADALNLLARDANWQLPARAVITPHPGEAARLLGCSTADVQADRFAAVAALLERGPGAVLLKGHGTLVATNDATSSGISLCVDGNPGMASGGMGDVLSGMAGALLARGLEVGVALRLACVLHAAAGDAAAMRRGQTSLLASDLAAELGALLP